MCALTSQDESQLGLAFFPLESSVSRQDSSTCGQIYGSRGASDFSCLDWGFPIFTDRVERERPPN